MESLFDEGTGRIDERPAADAPLAARMRPRDLEGYAGQEHLLAEGTALRSAIDEGHPHSMILHGPPGSGKTTLARLVASSSGAAFEELSAVNAGKPEVRAVLERARERRQAGGPATIVFLDEIHRFNKAQQDVLLPAVEEGLIVLIGATTENPYHDVNDALLSRVQLYELSALDDEVVRELLARALEEELGASAEDEALDFLAARSGGDARTALAALELAARSAGDGPVTLAAAEDALQRRAILYDRAGDRHYDTISAWIKATRGSDPDASLYYLAVMLEGGEDPRFIARRMVILASEDIGNADPGALQSAVAAAQAVELLGMPEAQWALAQAAIRLSLAPKSKEAYHALNRARQSVRDRGAADPPPYLHSPAAGSEPYEDPHKLPGHVGSQELMPDGLVGERFYLPDEAEERFAARLAELRKARGRGP